MLDHVGFNFVERCGQKKARARATDNKNEPMTVLDSFSYGTTGLYLQSVLTENGGINMTFGLFMESSAERWMQFVSR